MAHEVILCKEPIVHGNLRSAVLGVQFHANGQIAIVCILGCNAAPIGHVGHLHLLLTDEISPRSMILYYRIENQGCQPLCSTVLSAACQK